ncbi:MAG: hypothetical protein HYV63_18640 [Candidatus Schekmanbacteria bacterium]|nr:hypothetical protein [Candidatus Schekmanbacteria bacterium]
MPKPFLGLRDNPHGRLILLVIPSVGLVLAALLPELTAPRQARADILYEEPFSGANVDWPRTVPVFDPISAGDGAYYFNKRLLALGGPLPLSFELFYRSSLTHVREAASVPSRFWWRPFTTGFYSSALASFQLPDGGYVSFKKSNGA